MRSYHCQATSLCGHASHGRLLPEQALSPLEALFGAAFQAHFGTFCVVHDDDVAAAACAQLGVASFATIDRVWLGHRKVRKGPLADRAFAHEMAHLFQFRAGLAKGQSDPIADLEHEATVFETAALEAADRAIGRLRGAADPRGALGLWWLVPLAAGAYVLLRPNVANAPAPGDPVRPSVSEAQVAAEAFALFYAPGAAYSIAGRLGLGWMARSAVTGAVATTTFRGVQDTFEGEFSGVFAYIFDAITGAVIGVVTAGGALILRDKICVGVDWLATHGMRRSDIAITRRLAERAARGPVTAPEVEAITGRRGLGGRLASRWLERRGQIVLYRGQDQQTRVILSPIAREQGVAASRSMETRLRAAGLSSEEIAGYMARWHNTPVPGILAPPQLAGQPIGGVGIPTTRLPGIAANFGETGVVYTIRLPAGNAIRVPQWGLALENEFAVLHRIPDGSIVTVTPASRVPALTLDDAGRIVLPGN